VVHVAYEDAESYAEWAGKELPSEAQWERAARGGLEGATFTWGDEFAPDGVMMANTWQGEFPWQNLDLDGYEGTAPVGTFAANGYGLFDMAGNVWEWTADWYQSRHEQPAEKTCCAPVNPRGGAMEQSYDAAQPHIHIPRRVLKGGSFLCAPNYCLRYRPAARIPEMIDTATCHIGFRCVINQQ
jgi:formylglycine-generating enzyme required for sulfatase activity